MRVPSFRMHFSLIESKRIGDQFFLFLELLLFYLRFLFVRSEKKYTDNEYPRSSNRYFRIIVCVVMPLFFLDVTKIKFKRS
jgi:hypothetical protein